MSRTLLRSIPSIGLFSAAVLVFSLSSAHAGGYGSYGGGSHGSYGSKGVTYSSHGSSGSHGSHGSYSSRGSSGSHGGGFLSRIANSLHQFHNRMQINSSHGSHGSYGSHGSHGSYGSYGSHGSSGGTIITYGSYGSMGSYGSHGSHGGVIISEKPIKGKATEEKKIENGEEPPKPDAPEGGEEGALPKPGEARAFRGDAILSVSVPAEAKVFVNGRATTSEGTHRRYISRNLTPGYSYTYEIRAEVTRDGQKIEETKKIDLIAGATQSLAFDLQPAEAPETTLTVNVPADAKVTLAGKNTTATGAVRVYSTRALDNGKEWKNYKIEVKIEREGKTLSDEQTITLKAGDSRELHFNFDEEKVASTR